MIAGVYAIQQGDSQMKEWSVNRWSPEGGQLCASIHPSTLLQHALSYHRLVECVLGDICCPPLSTFASEHPSWGLSRGEIARLDVAVRTNCQPLKAGRLLSLASKGSAIDEPQNPH